MREEKERERSNQKHTGLGEICINIVSYDTGIQYKGRNTLIGFL